MYLEIVTPEAIVFSSEINSLSVPGVNGKFQMLNNHTPIISNLKKGKIIIEINPKLNADLSNLSERKILHEITENKLTLDINSGTLELNDNKAIILFD